MIRFLLHLISFTYSKDLYKGGGREKNEGFWEGCRQAFLKLSDLLKIDIFWRSILIFALPKFLPLHLKGILLKMLGFTPLNYYLCMKQDSYIKVILYKTLSFVLQYHSISEYYMINVLNTLSLTDKVKICRITFRYYQTVHIHIIAMSTLT